MSESDSLLLAHQAGPGRDLGISSENGEQGRRDLGGAKPANRAAVTLLELLVVMIIMTIISSAALPAIFTATRKAGVSRAVSELRVVIMEGQRLARLHTPDLAQFPTATSLAEFPHYGVAIVTDAGAPYVTLLYGQNINDEYQVDSDGDSIPDRPALRRSLGASVQIDIVPAAPRIAWFFAYGTGFPIQSPLLQAPISVGSPGRGAQSRVRTGSGWWNYRMYSPAVEIIPASPICTELRVTTRSGRYSIPTTLYSSGLLALGGPS